MVEAAFAVTLPSSAPGRQSGAALFRTFVIGLTAFLTVVDLFATQAILPSLAAAYRVSPAAMGFAVNASTMGMAVAGLAVALLSRHIDRRKGILFSLALLAIPTSLLAVAPSLAVFTVLRIIQGVFMASAFTLTLAYLAEHCSAENTAGAFAAYITGNVASNLFGRLMSAALADHLGLAAISTFSPCSTSPVPRSFISAWRARRRWRLWHPPPPRRWRPGASISAMGRYAPASRSASAFCSRSSARSPM